MCLAGLYEVLVLLLHLADAEPYMNKICQFGSLLM